MDVWFLSTYGTYLPLNIYIYIYITNCSWIHVIVSCVLLRKEVVLEFFLEVFEFLGFSDVPRQSVPDVRVDGCVMVCGVGGFICFGLLIWIWNEIVCVS